MEWLKTKLRKLSFEVGDLAVLLIGSSELGSWKESLGLNLQDFSSLLFDLGYRNSEAEIQDALNYSEEEFPSEAMSERQLEARRNAPADSYYYQNNGRLSC